MPILDPATQHAFLKAIKKNPSKYSKQFFLRYLKIASQGLIINPQTIQFVFQFKKDLKSSIKFLNNFFDCKFQDENVFTNPQVDNIFLFFYNNINAKHKTNFLKEQKGEYFHFTDNLNFEVNFFKPYIDYSEDHAWFLLDCNIAVLAINSLKKEESFIHLCILETDLMIASGFTVVLCLGKVKFPVNYLQKSLLSHPFAEIHINFSSNNYNQKEIDAFLRNLDDSYDIIKGYTYVYSENMLKLKNLEIFEKLVQKPRITFFYFSMNLNEVFKNIECEPISPFVYTKNGFENDKILIRLCNVPLFQTDDDFSEISSTEISGFTFAFISAKNFLCIDQIRVKVIIADPENDNHYVERYVNFDDIHEIKIDSYVSNTLYLAKTSSTTLNDVTKIAHEVNSIVESEDKFRKMSTISLFMDNKIKKDLKYVAYAYVKNAEILNPRFRIHENQILAALEACTECLFKKQRTNKGIIYQVDTGEGKSCIIQIIAAVLALMKKVVHITSSNINLANRDYYNSFGFYKQLGLSSAVLLHYNELPFINLNNSFDDRITYDKTYFPDKFFHPDLFNNTSNMNFSVCGINNDNELIKNKANVIFSTFINFESLYLKMMETCPGYVLDYFGDCSLLIDEADSILIDELANGTILSRSIKTNGNEVLKYVYENKMNGVSASDTLENIKQNWPNCVDIKIDDINEMYKEIELVNQEEFVDGKKYSIETIENNEKASLIDMLKSAQDNIENAKEKCKNEVKKFFKKLGKKRKSKNCDLEENYMDDDDYEENYEKVKSKKCKSRRSTKEKDKKSISTPEKDIEIVESSEEKESKSDNKMSKVIIPFDYDHKGILEPNKEFNGFIQQFIAIKEMINNKENSNMIIKSISMNYLFISHPIFVQLYDGVIGLTGTIGNKFDKKIYKEQYDLITKKIPRNMPNIRVEYPVLLCKDIEDRNQKIISEVIHFHEKDIPVLVIFQDLNEISDVLYLLVSKGIKNINIFDGKDEKVKPDIIAGLKGAVSLGTNSCGRGTDIQKPAKPLHVIISYFTSNARVLQQAFGRTARQGQNGSVRIICTEIQYYVPIDQFNKKEVDETLDDFNLKNKWQIKFIETFKKNREWIFLGGIKSQKLSKGDIKQLRETRINSNRIKVCNFVFPICMSIKTFLTIQSQKIFSLFNCPNCKYTWRLFQQYIREMILESWSLLIDRSEQKYNKKKRIISYEHYLKSKIQKVINLLKEYLPDSNDRKDYEIVPTFMHIFNRVRSTYEDKIMSLYQGNLVNFYKKSDMNRFCSFLVGFKPFSLVDESGAKINTVDGNDQDQHYISDPELKYIQKMPDGHSLIISITQKIDGIFNE